MLAQHYGICCFLQLKEKNSRIEELDGEVLSVQGQLENVASTLNVHIHVSVLQSPNVHVHPCPVQGLSQEKDALDKELSDLKDELVVAEQEKDKAMKERKIAEDFEYKLEIERTKLLREVHVHTCMYMYVE